jgi:hypothetical protein
VHHLKLLSVLHMDCCMGCWLAFAKYSRYHAELKVRGVHGHLHSFTIVWKESGAIMLRDRGVCVGPTHTAEHCQKSCRNQQIFKSDSSRWSRSAHAQQQARAIAPPEPASLLTCIPPCRTCWHGLRVPSSLFQPT